MPSQNDTAPPMDIENADTDTPQSTNSVEPIPNSPVEAGYNVTSSAVGTDQAIFDCGDYTVGWICALPTELAAAKAMLDEQHQALPARHKDNNTYVLGRVGDHNVAIACLPSQTTGTVSAASVSQQKLATFESIRFGLMVGIGAAHSPAGQPAFFSMDTIMSMVLDLF